jgi:hypothetical protein
MDIGVEVLEDTIYDWTRDKALLVALDDDGWLKDSYFNGPSRRPAGATTAEGRTSDRRMLTAYAAIST